MDWSYVIESIVEFSGVYGLANGIRSMIGGMLLLPFILLLRFYGKKREAEFSFYTMLLLLPAAFSGKNRLFLQNSC